MASIQKRDNGRWRARYRDAAGREHAKHFDRKTDAQSGSTRSPRTFSRGGMSTLERG